MPLLPLGRRLVSWMLAGAVVITAYPAHAGGTATPAHHRVTTPSTPSGSTQTPSTRAASARTASARAASARAASTQTAPATPRTGTPPKPQPRPHSARVAIDASKIRIDDGDTIVIAWGANDEETVRILGIDCPETRHPQHDIPYGQAFGEEARAFALGAFAAAPRVELLRASMLDPYGRTLAYVFLNGRNYSVLAIDARLAEESITRYGDNGFPAEARTIVDAAKLAGPPPFEPPGAYRQRMKGVTQWMKSKGTYPSQ